MFSSARQLHIFDNPRLNSFDVQRRRSDPAPSQVSRIALRVSCTSPYRDNHFHVFS
jgi:hypothetical protein